MIHSLLAFWHAMYVPRTGPFYDGQVWGNVFVIAVLAPAGWVWSRTKFWPLGPLHRQFERLHAKLDAHHAAVRDLHARHDAHAEQLAKLAARLDEVHAKLPERRKRSGS